MNISDNDINNLDEVEYSDDMKRFGRMFQYYSSNLLERMHISNRNNSSSLLQAKICYLDKPNETCDHFQLLCTSCQYLYCENRYFPLRFKSIIEHLKEHHGFIYQSAKRRKTSENNLE